MQVLPLARAVAGLGRVLSRSSSDARSSALALLLFRPGRRGASISTCRMFRALKREADAELARIARCSGERRKPRRPSLMPTAGELRRGATWVKA